MIKSSHATDRFKAGEYLAQESEIFVPFGRSSASSKEPATAGRAELWAKNSHSYV